MKEDEIGMGIADARRRMRRQTKVFTTLYVDGELVLDKGTLVISPESGG